MRNDTSPPRFGLILRAFSRKPEDVEKKAQEVVDAIDQALHVVLNGKPWFDNILVLVPMDDRYEQCDTGNTAGAIGKLLGAASDPRVRVEEFRRGDNFCGTLNHGLAQMLHEGIDYVTILSSDARECLDEGVALRIKHAVASGAKVVGVAIKELEDSIRKGRVANTLATWDVKALVAVGSFDLLAAQAVKEDEEANRLAGVEEIIPLLRLVDAHGPCIAIVPPASDGCWKASAAPAGSDAQARQRSKLDSKPLRQALRAKQVGGKLSTLEGAVMRIPAGG